MITARFPNSLGLRSKFGLSFNNWNFFLNFLTLPSTTTKNRKREFGSTILRNDEIKDYKTPKRQKYPSDVIQHFVDLFKKSLYIVTIFLHKSGIMGKT